MSSIIKDLMTADVGLLTRGLRDNAEDVYECWMRLPFRRDDYGARELTDIRETYQALGILLREIDKQKLRIVSNG